jgi:predicted transcriptional regulator
MIVVKLSDAIKAIDGELLYGVDGHEGCAVDFIVASDLMSDVLVVDQDNLMLVTSLVARQSLKTAHLVGASALVIVNGKTLQDDLLELAEELELSVIRSPLSKFQCCVRLGKLLEL